MKKIFIIAMLLSAMLNGAKLKYTSEKTDSYKSPEGDIIVRYAKNPRRSYPVNVFFYDGVGGSPADVSYIKKELGVTKDKISVFESRRIPKKSPESTHMFTGMSAFTKTAGKEFFAENQGRSGIIERIEPHSLPLGILSISAYGFTGSLGFATSDGYYFGNIINELSGNTHQTPRVLGLTSNEDNLFLNGLANDNTVGDEALVSGDPDMHAVHPSQETFFMPMFGIEAQKLMRAELIKVKDYSCTEKTASNPVKRISRECFVNDSDKSDRYPTWALYARTHTVAARGDIDSYGEISSGSSFATPRLAGLITRIMKKYDGLSYLQAKQIVLTTATRDRDELDSYIGWGIVNEEKAMNGPSMLVPGLIEEEKFFAGNYDRIYDGMGNAYMWVDTYNNWTWSNDIYGPFHEHPEGTVVKNIIAGAKDKDGEIVQPKLAFRKVKNVSFNKYIPSEYNYYADTATHLPGLRKAGGASLTLTGNLYYEGPTQVLEGTLVIKGKALKTEITVYEGATLEVHGSAAVVKLAGGKLVLGEGAKVGKVIADPTVSSRIAAIGNAEIKELYAKKSSHEGVRNIQKLKVGKIETVKEQSIPDVVINPSKYQDIKREYFLSKFKDHIDDIYGGKNTFKEFEKRYVKMKNAPEYVKKGVPGYVNGKFTIDNVVSAEEQEYTRYPNPVFSMTTFVATEGMNVKKWE